MTKKIEKIYGIHSAMEILKTSPDRILNIWLQDSAKSKPIVLIHDAAKNIGLSIQLSKRDRLDKMTNNKNHQGVVLEIKETNEANSNNLDEVLKKNENTNPIYLILDSIQDPHNLGACIRTAVAAGVSAIIIPKDRAVGVNETVKKVACGAAENITIITVVNLVRAIKKIKEMGIWVIGAVGNTEESIYDFDLKGAIAIVIGGEDKGLRALVRNECDFIGSLPITKKIESLNTSVATGIILFEAVRQRKSM